VPHLERDGHLAAHDPDGGDPAAHVRILTRAALALLIGFALAAGHRGEDESGSNDPAEIEIVRRIEAGAIDSAVSAALERCRSLPPDEAAAFAERLAGKFYESGTPEGARAAASLYEKALALREPRAASAPLPLAALLHDLSGLRFNGGDYAGAETAEARALALREGALPASDFLVALSRRDLGFIFMVQGRLAEAADLMSRALPIIEAAPQQDFTQLAVGRNYLAELYRLQGRYGEAAALLERLARDAEQKLGEANAQFPYFLNNLAGVYRDQDRFDEAELLLRRSLALRERAEPRDDGAVARATLNLAELERVQGKLDDALPLYREALTLAQRSVAPDSPELFEFVNQLAVLRRDQGKLDEAAAGFRKSLALVEQALGAEDIRVAQSRLDLAELLRAQGRCSEAEQSYARAVAIRATVLGDRHPDVAEALVGSARCRPATDAGRKQALADTTRALEILAESRAQSTARIEALALRSDLLAKADPVASQHDLDEALAAVETLRPHRGGGETVRAEFFSRYAPLFEKSVRAKVAAGDVDGAVRTVERARARVLLDQLAAAHVGEGAEVSPDLARREAAVRAELAEIRERRTFEESRSDVSRDERRRRIEELTRRREEAEREFRSGWDERRNASPAWRGVVGATPATLREIQDDVVPADGLVLLYEIGKEGSYVFGIGRAPGAAVVRPLTVSGADAQALGIRAGALTEAALARVLSDGSSATRGLLADLATPAATALRGIGQISSGPGPSPTTARLHALWRVLVPRELQARALAASEVLVVPDGPLCLLPFEALVVEPAPDAASTRYWLDAAGPIRYAPSATFVRQLSRQDPRADAAEERLAVLSVSDPDFGSPRSATAAGSVRAAYLETGGTLARLPGTAVETRRIREALEGVGDVVVLQGKEAREPAVRRELAGKRFLHFATHGIVDDRRGSLFAALALAAPPKVAAGDDDGFLELFEIYDFHLRCELAVLSACSSNTGRIVNGEGVFALSRGFLVGGARRVVASQWPVDDDSTAELVANLFREIASGEKERVPVHTAKALRDAKRKLRQTKQWQAPFYWAPFVLTGAP